MTRVRPLLLLALLAALATGATVTLDKFTGELSPYMEGRSDLSIYQTGLRELTNMVVETQGGVAKRPGTYFINETAATATIGVPGVDGDYPTLRATTDQADPSLTHTTAISNLTELAAMADNLSGNYYLTGNIDASGTAAGDYNSGYGWQPIGTQSSPFTGTFDGVGYSISDLTIDREYVLGLRGLFGYIRSPAKIANVTLADCDMSIGRTSSGALVGQANANATSNVLIQNCHVTGTVQARGTTPTFIGGLVGWADGDAVDKQVFIYDCTTTCSVNAESYGEATQVTYLGGLVGVATFTKILNCSASGNVTGTDLGASYVGGLIGSIGTAGDNSEVTYSSATGDVFGEDFVGGFAGHVLIPVATGFIRKCSATGDVTADGTATSDMGGFVGKGEQGEFTDCYAWGDVTNTGGGDPVGGFVGNDGTTLTNVYSVGLITTDGTYSGGLVGDASGVSDTSCYWDTETSGQSTSDAGTGHITTWMKTKTNYTDAGWDFDTIWYSAYVAGTETTYDLEGEPVRLISYTYKTDESYTVEVGKYHMKFYKEAD